MTEWAPYNPGGARPWTLSMAGHLYRRACFGANWTQLQQALEDGPQRTIDKLFQPAPDPVSFSASLAQSDSASSDRCAEFWLHRMMESPCPLLEKLTLFWHGFFPVLSSRVGRESLMERHVLLLRRHALGRFDAMLRDICRDPATLVSLDARFGRKAQPPIELARALLNSYTVGPKSHGEDDVRDAARALTGGYVLNGEYRFLPNEHDDREKSVLGRKGNLDGDQVIDAALAHPATPQNVVRRLYSWLISESAPPTADLIAPLAESFAKDYDITRLVNVMLRSNLFFSESAFRQRVKSPIEFTLGIASAFQTTLPCPPLHRQLVELGQNLLDPPPDGWPGGRWWLNRFTWTARKNVAASILSRVNTQSIEARYAGQLLLQRPAGSDIAGIIGSPEYQLC